MRRCFAPLTGCPGCATSQGATGDISSRAAPFPCPGKGRGDRVERFPLKPLFSLLICGQLTISKSCPARVSNSGFVGAGIVSFPMLKAKYEKDPWSYLPPDLLPSHYSDIRARSFLTKRQQEQFEKKLFYASRIIDE